ncbi:hypothetical protein ACH5RR_021363 [Cinchona calisaya]|uniref:Uncharacterized protein n=1 Tax=Cinchona calisaya TaxID=153742 RepID=A0ABD2ZH44_9GENT
MASILSSSKNQYISWQITYLFSLVFALCYSNFARGHEQNSEAYASLPNVVFPNLAKGVPIPLSGPSVRRINPPPASRKMVFHKLPKGVPIPPSGPLAKRPPPQSHKLVFPKLPKGVPIPPSGPSNRTSDPPSPPPRNLVFPKLPKWVHIPPSGPSNRSSDPPPPPPRKLVFPKLPKGAPIPPSGPSKGIKGRGSVHGEIGKRWRETKGGGGRGTQSREKINETDERDAKKGEDGESKGEIEKKGDIKATMQNGTKIVEIEETVDMPAPTQDILTLYKNKERTSIVATQTKKADLLRLPLTTEKFNAAVTRHDDDFTAAQNRGVVAQDNKGTSMPISIFVAESPMVLFELHVPWEIKPLLHNTLPKS